MDRHPDDVPTLIRNKEEFKEYVGQAILDGTYYYGKEKDNPDELYEYFKGWIDHPLDYPCMMYIGIEEMDPRPGWDFILHFFYIEDARELYAAKFLEVA